MHRPRRIAPLHPVALAAGLLLAACSGADAPADDTADAPVAETTIVVADAGLMTPESVLHDPDADVYLVSNINGDPTAVDGNGFISRLAPDGTVADLRWIDGADEGVTLNAPKGLALQGGSLFVTDIDCVRIFDRNSGAPTGEVCVPDATFLNDIAPDESGTLFVTDSGLRGGAQGLEPSGTDALYRLSPDGRMAQITAGDWMGRPNGVAVGARGIFVVAFGSGEVFQIAVDGDHSTVMPASERQLDGIEFMDDGGFVFTSWGDQAVYRVGGDGAVSRILEDVEAPADLGIDRERGRILVPLFTQNQVLIHPLPS